MSYKDHFLWTTLHQRLDGAKRWCTELSLQRPCLRALPNASDAAAWRWGTQWRKCTQPRTKNPACSTLGPSANICNFCTFRKVESKCQRPSWQAINTRLLERKGWPFRTLLYYNICWHSWLSRGLTSSYLTETGVREATVVQWGRGWELRNWLSSLALARLECIRLHYGHRKCPRFLNILCSRLCYMSGRQKIYNSLLCELGCLK